MARPLKTSVDYFKHDTDMSQDEKVQTIERLHGLNGYAVYLKMLERIYRNGGELNLENMKTAATMAEKCHVPSDLFMVILDDAADIGLFDKTIWINHRILTGNSIKKRLAPVQEERQRVRELMTAKRGQNKVVTSKLPVSDENNVVTTQAIRPINTITPVVTNKSRVEESRVEESNNHHPPTPLKPGGGNGEKRSEEDSTKSRDDDDDSVRVFVTQGIEDWAKDQVKAIAEMIPGTKTLGAVEVVCRCVQNFGKEWTTEKLNDCVRYQAYSIADYLKKIHSNSIAEKTVKKSRKKTPEQIKALADRVRAKEAERNRIMGVSQ